jgi:hypothetical protein
MGENGKHEDNECETDDRNGEYSMTGDIEKG